VCRWPTLLVQLAGAAALVGSRVVHIELRAHTRETVSHVGTPRCLLSRASQPQPQRTTTPATHSTPSRCSAGKSRRPCCQRAYHASPTPAVSVCPPHARSAIARRGRRGGSAEPGRRQPPDVADVDARVDEGELVVMVDRGAFLIERLPAHASHGPPHPKAVSNRARSRGRHGGGAAARVWAQRAAGAAT